jgi:aminoglycoside phosphotransferase (APT) family kinase protein
VHPDRAQSPLQFDLDALQRRLAQAGFPLTGPLSSELITTGRSNLTYAITDRRSRWILRRPPLGHVLATAHDMQRELVVLSALEATAVPVPSPLHFCETPEVIGAPFLIMEYIAGPVLSSAAEAAALSRQQALDCSRALVDALVTLHRLRPADVGLESLGRGEGFLKRQILRWRRQWRDSTAATAAASPALERLADLLAAHQPAVSRTTVVHGDYRLGNVILDPGDPGQIAAIIDWEMATLGDPLADLGLLLAYWDPASSMVTAGGYLADANPGFLTAAQLTARYAEGSGADLGDLAFYRVFGFFKLAVIAQTIVARHLKGAAVGEGLPEVAGAVDALIEAGLRAAAAFGSDPGLRP